MAFYLLPFAKVGQYCTITLKYTYIHILKRDLQALIKRKAR